MRRELPKRPESPPVRVIKTKAGWAIEELTDDGSKPVFRVAGVYSTEQEAERVVGVLHGRNG
jgi:hypothetical protein